MKVEKILDVYCENCNCTSTKGYEISINAKTVLLCEECKHDLAFEIMSN